MLIFSNFALYKLINTMNQKNLFGKILAFILLATVVFGTTSCNRGYGCPYNTSISKAVEIVDFSILD